LGFKIATSQYATGQWHELALRTARFDAVDDRHVVWVGLPGYISSDYPGFLFPPQPIHLWHNSAPEILMQRIPIGTGPYRVSSWEGNELALEANPFYVGSKPWIESVVFKQLNADTVYWPEALKAGTCDIILPDNFDSSKRWLTWEKAVDLKDAVIWYVPSSMVLRLDFNLADQSKRVIPLNSTRTRLALANCISRENLMELPLGAYAIPAVSFIPPLHPAYEPDTVWRVPFSIEVGQGILHEEGWSDIDGDGIREAHQVQGVRDGTPMTLTLATSTYHLAVAETLAEDFEKCGVGITIDASGPQEFYAASAVSPLVNGSFDLALTKWHAEPADCLAWMSHNLAKPGIVNRHVNYGAYSDSAFDDACLLARSTLDAQSQAIAIQTAQDILADAHATLFLVWQPKWLLSQPDLTELFISGTASWTIYQPEKMRWLDDIQ
ncbi:MAG: ABC transporter substrate-binding protein, partial [Anaerolineae bacterium]|nr:ABC transporter substrate-binding protein [Anaerolineae bacterium]